MASVSYESAVFALNELKLSAESFQCSVDPTNWKLFSAEEVTVKEAKLAKLQSLFFSCQQTVIFACSIHENKNTVMAENRVILSDCEELLDKAHISILCAKEIVKSAKQKVMDESKKGQSSVESDFKLEKTKPPTFNGNYTEWQNYSDLFKAAIIDNQRISGALKLVYLKNSLIGDAASIASSFPSNNLSFQEAWELVESRYNKKREIVFSHLHLLFSMTTVPDTNKGILKMVDTINQCLRSLKVLEVKVENWDVFIVYWAHLKLDPETKKQWLLASEDDLPSLSDFLSFLEKRATALTPSTSKNKSGDKSTSAHYSTVDGKKKFLCPKCEEKHKIYSCPKFLELSPPDRSKFSKQSKLCINCLGFHLTRECKSESVCSKCGKTHHTLLHFETKAQSTSNPHSTSTVKSESVSRSTSSDQVALDSVTTNGQVRSHHSTSTIQSDNVVLMATLIVNVADFNGDLQPCRVFLDQGSEADFISESLVSRLNLKRRKSCVQITGIGNSSGESARGMVTFTIRSRLNNFVLPVKALVLPKLTGFLPRATCSGNFPHLEGLSLSDPEFYVPAKIEILLGAESASRILLPGLKTGPTGTPTAQNSKFGWFLTGPAPLSRGHTNNFSVSVCHASCSVSESCLESSLVRFWELDDPPSSSPLSPSDISVESHFLRTFTRDKDGRYEVKLPFSNIGELGESRSRAMSCFKSLEKQLDRDPQLKNGYHTQIEDLISRDWVEVIPDSEISTKKVKVISTDGESFSLSPYYLPHHVVVKPDNTTTKFRVVFNASSKSTSGLSLNSILHAGPKIQTDLHPLLIRLRTHPVALCADIVKFCNQVKVFPPHCDFQRFLWRKHPGDNFIHLRFLRVTFGVTSAPFLAIRVLRQLGEDFKEDFPLVHLSIQNDFLVDNLLSGASSVEEALEMKSQITQVLSHGKFPLQKWASNHPDVLSSLSPEDRDTFSLDLKIDDSIKTIGLFWHPASDTFGVKISPQPTFTAATKREILSHVARVFDPLQWLSPVTISAKILLQSLWKEKVGWDDPIPLTHLKKWRKYSSQLELLKGFRVPRCLTFTTFSDFHSIRHDLIGFCDASNQAYAACVYLRSKFESSVKVQLVASKSKVAPVGGETTPTLELCSAVLLCQLVNFVSSALMSTKIHIESTTCFTDSTGALGQLFSSEKQPVFVANRVRKIKNSQIPIRWLHVPGEVNPADFPSRGISASNFLQCSIWLHGPPFLLTSEIPPQPYQDSVATFSVSVSAGRTFVDHCMEKLIVNSSSFFKMKRLLTYWIRFLDNLIPGNLPTYGPLTLKELEKAQLSLMEFVQSVCFKSEIENCTQEKPTRGQLRFLSPFLDKDGVLRVGGRLQLSKLNFRSRHQILLPKCHSRPSTPNEKFCSHFVLCVVRDFHKVNLHAGPKLLLSLVRSEFWIPRCQDLCSRVFRQCIPCFKQHPQPAIQIMGQLPESRVTPDFPFVKVGINYAGPFEIAATPGRKPRLIKAYVCVFICMATRAIHLEFSGGLSTPDFISAFQRFCSIRNSPSEIFCDGGRNFLGAKNDMEDLQKLLSSDQHREKVSLFFTGEKVNFHFSPPYGPHHGGIWEAAVKSMKVHLARVVQGHHISIEEFITLLARTSAALNSRPLTPLSNNPDDFEVITPFHFLSLRAPKFVPEEDVTTMKSHRNRWQLVQQMSQHLFKRWSSDFLQSLQQKQKWLSPQQNISKGTLVLLQDVDSSFKHQRWIPRRIEEVFPGPDGKVRTVDVRVPIRDDPEKPFSKTKGKVTFKTKVYRRPITRVSPLPMDDDITGTFSTLQN